MNIEREMTFTNSAECEIIFLEATECLKKRENRKAIKLFDELIEREPDNIYAINGKGSGLMQDGLLDEAMEQFNRSLEIKENEMAYLNKAIIHANKGDYDNALSYCDKTIEVFPDLNDVVNGLKNNILENMNAKLDDDLSEFDDEAQELIVKAGKLMDENGTLWNPDSSHQEILQDVPEFRRITLWDAWGSYEQAMRNDPKCERMVLYYINELKSDLLREFLFFDISQNDDFNPQGELDRLKLEVMKAILLDNDYSYAMAATKSLLAETDQNDLDALSFHGALSFYFDEYDDAIESFEKMGEKGSGVYKFFADYNKAFVLRRKTMVTGDGEYMIQAMDIYDEMLKDPQNYDKVKPYQREILDKLQEFMKVPLF